MTDACSLGGSRRTMSVGDEPVRAERRKEEEEVRIDEIIQVLLSPSLFECWG